MGARDVDTGAGGSEIEGEGEGEEELSPRLLALAFAGVLSSFPSVGSVALAAADERRILVFGDSLTWGWTPARPIAPTVRYPLEDRWTTAMGEALEVDHVLIVDGLNGRTTDVADADEPTLDGSARLPSVLAENAPLDLVIVMLGTNDTQAGYARSAFEIGLGAIELIGIVERSDAGREPDGSGPDVLLISPPALAEEIDPRAAADFAGAREKSLWLPTVYAAIAGAAGVDFLDAGAVVSTDGIDGIHLTAEANDALGRAVADRVNTLLDERADARSGDEAR